MPLLFMCDYQLVTAAATRGGQCTTTYTGRRASRYKTDDWIDGRPRKYGRQEVQEMKCLAGSKQWIHRGNEDRWGAGRVLLVIHVSYIRDEQERTADSEDT